MHALLKRMHSCSEGQVSRWSRIAYQCRRMAIRRSMEVALGACACKRRAEDIPRGQRHCNRSLSLCVCVSLCTNDRKQSAHTPITDGLSALFTYHVKDAREQQPWKRFRTGAGTLGARAVAPSWVTRRGPRLLRLQLLWLKAQRAWHSRSMSRKIQIDSLMSIL